MSKVLTIQNDLIKPIILTIIVGFSFVSMSQSPFFEWANGNEMGYSWGFAITSDHNDDVYSTGIFDETITIETLSGDVTLTSLGGNNCIVQKMTSDGQIAWAKALTSTGDIRGYSIITDNDGVYFAGFFSGTADFDPGPEELNITSSNSSEIYVCKLSLDGDFIWVKTMVGISGSTQSTVNSMTLDSNGDLLLTGEFDGSVDFDPGPSTLIKASEASTDVFVQKLDSEGNLIWIQTFEGTSLDNGFAIAVDNSNNVYITGRFHGTVDFDPGVDVNFHTDESEFGDIFVTKLNEDGDLIWVNTMGGDQSDFGEDLTVDSEGNIYVFGRFRLTVDFDPGPDDEFKTALGFQNSFIQKLDSSGGLIWIKTIEADDGGSNYNIARSIVLDNEENILICGDFHGIIDMDPDIAIEADTSHGLSDMYIEKWSSDGEFIWGFAIGSEWTDLATDIVVDSDNGVYITGCYSSFSNPVDFDPGTDSFHLENPTNRSIFVAKYEEGFIGLPDQSVKNKLLIYPNPFKDVVMIEPINTEGTISIYSPSGNLIFNQLVKGNTIINLSGLHSGIYYLVYRDIQGTFMQTMVKI